MLSKFSPLHFYWGLIIFYLLFDPYEDMGVRGSSNNSTKVLGKTNDLKLVLYRVALHNIKANIFSCLCLFTFY